jgi:hypothetical protein
MLQAVKEPMLGKFLNAFQLEISRWIGIVSVCGFVLSIDGFHDGALLACTVSRCPLMGLMMEHC